MTRLAETVLIDPTTLTRNLRPPEGLGLIRIVSGKDLRVREVRITARGREVLATALPLWERGRPGRAQCRPRPAAPEPVGPAV